VSIETVELYRAFEESLGKEKAQLVVKDITNLINEARQELVTRENLRETELKLTKEIEIVRKEIKEIELKQTKEIEGVRLTLTKEIEGVRLTLTKEIEGVRKEVKEIELKLTHEIGEVKLEVEKVRSSVIKWIAGLLVAQTGVIITIIMLFK
jgi:hypothetical protein